MWTAGPPRACRPPISTHPMTRDAPQRRRPVIHRPTSGRSWLSDRAKERWIQPTCPAPTGSAPPIAARRARLMPPTRPPDDPRRGRRGRQRPTSGLRRPLDPACRHPRSPPPGTSPSRSTQSAAFTTRKMPSLPSSARPPRPPPRPPPRRPPGPLPTPGAVPTRRRANSSWTAPTEANGSAHCSTRGRPSTS